MRHTELTPLQAAVLQQLVEACARDDDAETWVILHDPYITAAFALRRQGLAEAAVLYDPERPLEFKAIFRPTPAALEARHG